MVGAWKKARMWAGNFCSRCRVAQLALEGAAVARRGTLGQAALDVLVEELVGVMLGRVGRQEDQLDPVAVRGHPGLDRLGVMHPEMVDDQEDLALGTLDQALEEGEEEVGVEAPS